MKAYKNQKIVKKNEVQFLNDCLLINNSILVFSDFHIGYEEKMLGKSPFIRTQFKEIIEKLDMIFDYLSDKNIKVKKIIILGDLKHEFGQISDAEWRESLQLLDYFLKKTKQVILVRGNHDTILGPIAKKRKIKIVGYYIIDDMCFLHGNKLLDKNILKKIKIIFLGHLHPAITLSDEYKNEKFKCFLRGKWKGKESYVLPSFSEVSFGYDLSSFREEKKKEFFVIDRNKLKNFEVIIYNKKENKGYNFGKLKYLSKI